MKYCLLPATLMTLFFFQSCSKKIIPDKPVIQTAAVADTIPFSQIDIPVQVPLQSLVAMAEKEIDLQYTSPGWPYDFVVDSCSSRYMYKFRRGPIKLSGAGNEMKLEFMGYYQIAGSQRLCTGVGSNLTGITPWSPPCTCGLKEGERRVQVGFTVDIRLNSDYSTDPHIRSIKPVPLDKCSMCLWNTDMTSTIMERLLVQMEDARKAIEDNIRTMQLRPKFQLLWDSLNGIIPVYGRGYLQINPEKIRISRFQLVRDTLVFSLGLTARPSVSQKRPNSVPRTVIPDIDDFQLRKGFSLFLDAHLDYDSMSTILNEKMHKKRIDLEQVGKYVIVENIMIYGADGEQVIFKLDFSGPESGTFYLTGKPVFDAVKKQIYVNDLDYDIRTRDMLVKTAKWLFNRKILQTLQTYARFDLSTHEHSLIGQLNKHIPRELYKGVWIHGNVQTLSLSRIHPSKEKLFVRFTSSGNVSLVVTNPGF